MALVTKEVTSSGVKAVLLAALAGATALVTAYVNNAGLLTQDVVVAAIQNFVVAVAAYYGLWKPTTVAPTVAEKTKNIGI